MPKGWSVPKCQWNHTLTEEMDLPLPLELASELRAERGAMIFPIPQQERFASDSIRTAIPVHAPKDGSMASQVLLSKSPIQQQAMAMKKKARTEEVAEM